MNYNTVFHTTMALLLLSGNAAMALAADPGPPARGPIPFEEFDVNGDGGISQEEFDTIHAQRIQQRAEAGFPMRNLDNAPGFADIDANGDGRLSQEELQKYHRERMETRQQNRSQSGGMGMGSGQGGGMAR